MRGQAGRPRRDQEERGLKEQAAGAVVWMGASRVGTQVLDQVFTLVLVRLLVPADFGLLAMAGVFTALLNVVSDMGIARAIVQRREVDDEYVSTAFWGNLAMGIVLSLLAFLAAGPIARLFGEPAVRPVFAALALRFIIAGTGATQAATLWRGLDARRLVAVNMTSVVMAGVVGVVLARMGAGVWALVAQSLVNFSARSALLWVAVPWRPVARFSWEKFKDLWGFGSRILAARIFRYVIVQADNLLIGRLLGAVWLGYYAFGYGMFLSPLNDFSHTIGQVIFPAFSRLQEDLPRLRRGVLAVSRYTTLFALPVLLGLLLVAHDVIAVLFGTKWLPAVPVARILLIAALLQVHTSIWQTVFTSMGRADWVFKWSFAAACVYVPAFAIGLRWGITGVAAGYTASTLLLMPVQLILLLRVTGLRLATYLRSQQGLVAAAAVMTAAVLLAQAWAGRLGTAVWFRLSLSIAVGMVCYAAAVTAMQRELVVDVWRTVRALRRPRGAGALAGEAG